MLGKRLARNGPPVDPNALAGLDQMGRPVCVREWVWGWEVERVYEESECMQTVKK